MTWFRYLPSTGNPSASTQDENYIYPLIKRKINIPNLNQSIPADSWIFVNVEGLNIDKFVNNSLAIEQKSNSYLTVYESKYSDQNEFKPVKSHINGNLLFFKTSELHDKNTEIDGQYSIYYKTDNIKSIKEVQNGLFKDFISCDTIDAEFITSSGDVDETFFDVYPYTNQNYSFSFSNSGIDWKNGVSLIPGAKLIGAFTGPFFELYCEKGPDLGKFEIRFVSLGLESNLISTVEQDWIVIDLFSSQKLENQLVYSKNNFDYKNYIFEIISNFEKNDLSSNGKIKIDHYSYGYDAHCRALSEEISPYLVSRRILGGSVNG